MLRQTVGTGCSLEGVVRRSRYPMASNKTEKCKTVPLWTPSSLKSLQGVPKSLITP